MVPLHIPNVLETSLRHTHLFCLFSKHQGKHTDKQLPKIPYDKCLK